MSVTVDIRAMTTSILQLEEAVEGLTACLCARLISLIALQLEKAVEGLAAR